MNKSFLILFLLAPLTLFASGKANQDETEKNLSTIEIQLLIDEIRESNKGFAQLFKEEAADPRPYTQVTMRYAHLSTKALREAANSAAVKIRG